MKKKQENEILEWIKTLGLAAILAVGIRTFIAEPRYIPSGSMIPTLKVNDRLFVEKITYRFREPKRGDIVVFSPTEALKTDGHTDDFIKRIIGLPGEKIELRDGKVYVNDRSLKEKYTNKEGPDNRESIAALRENKQNQNFGPVVVPENEYLVLGDNRNSSLDSRVWGFVPRENFIGRAAIRFYPFNRIGSLYQKPIYPQNQPKQK